MAKAKKKRPAAKKAAKARQQAARKKAEQQVSWQRRLWRWVWRLAVVGFVCAAIALVVLDFWVRDKFESHQWTLPAQVYARPLELYEGRQLSHRNLKQVLSLMRYREDGTAATPGSYAVLGETVLVHTRGFQDSDGGEQSKLISLRIKGGVLIEVSDSAAKGIIARLEPLQVGSIHPGHAEDRVFVTLDQVPDTLEGMLLATEDKAFYQHHGISFRGLLRAVFVNIKSGAFQQGGSTITQQLVKNFWLTRDRTLARKLIEIPMAMLLELHYSKAQILEAYLNEVYLGQDGARAIHGMGLAARFYFGRPLQELSISQQAMLVGLLKGPSYYDPRRHPERAQDRRNLVLAAAFEDAIIDAKKMAEEKARSLQVVPKGGAALYAFPGFVDLVKRQLARDYDADRLVLEGLRIHTTLDVLAQLEAESALSAFLSKDSPVNGAVVVTSPHQGDVLALVGDKVSRMAGFNRALDAVRPIGSLAKPVVVLAALQSHRWHLGSLVDDSPFSVRIDNKQMWSPKNYDGKSLGPIPMYQALAKSRNQSIARLGMDVGLAEVLGTFRQMGVKQPIPPYPSVFLGSLELSPFEVAVMYQTFATGGYLTPLRSITDVLDNDGQPIARYPVAPVAVMNEEHGYLMHWALRQVIDEGTGRYALTHLPDALVVAGKTGTSDDGRDAWFAGYSGNRLAVVWLGADDNRATQFTGSNGALRVWADLMRKLPQQPLALHPPEDVEMVWLDIDGQRLSSEGCEGAYEVPMRAAHIPDESSRCGKTRTKSKGVFKWFKDLIDVYR